MKSLSRLRTRGLTMVEVLIASSIILVTVVVLLGVHSLYLKTALANGSAVKAAYLAEEGIEVMRYLRDASWSTNIAPLSLETPYGLALSSAWVTNATSTWIGKFYRTVTISSVERDPQSDIITGGGSGPVDPNTLFITVSVSWPENGATTTKSISTYLTNLYDN